MDYYRFFPVLFQADTIHLTLAQDGAYRRLIDHYMLTRQPLPDNDGALARIVGCGMAEWLEIAPSIRPFFKRQNGQLHNKRCNAELDWQDNKLKTRKEIAQKGVEARRNKIKGLATNGQPTVNRDVTRGEERRREEIRKEEVSTPLPPRGDAPSKPEIHPFVVQWNELALKHGLPTVRGMTPKRQKQLRVLAASRSPDDVTACLTAVAASPFLTGTNDRGWRCDFDFILRPDKFQAILEGKYNGTAPVKLSPLTSAVGRLLREGAEREPVSDGAGNPYLNGNDAPAGLAHTSIRQIDAPLPAAKRPWGG